MSYKSKVVGAVRIDPTHQPLTKQERKNNTNRVSRFFLTMNTQLKNLPYGSPGALHLARSVDTGLRKMFARPDLFIKVRTGEKISPQLIHDIDVDFVVEQAPPPDNRVNSHAIITIKHSVQGKGIHINLEAFRMLLRTITGVNPYINIKNVSADFALINMINYVRKGGSESKGLEPSSV